jgi:hypothetical protein
MPLFEPNLMTIIAGASSATGPAISLANGGGLSFGIVGNTITATADYIRSISAGLSAVTGNQVVFGNSNGVSFGANGQTITASIDATVGAVPITIFSQWGGFETNYSVSAMQISYQKVSLPMPMLASSGVVLMDVAGHSLSSGGMTILAAAYTMSQSTASLFATGSGGFSWTSGSVTTASSVYGGVSGVRYRPFEWNVSMTPGDYLFAFALSTTNDGSARIFGRQGVSIAGLFAGAETAFFLDGVQLQSSGALPTVVLASDTNYARTGVSAVQQPGFILLGTV